jgi:hypothetical protein
MWSEAIRNYDCAVTALDTDDQLRAELQAKAGVACFYHHDPARATERLLPSIAELEAEGNITTLGVAALALHRCASTLTDDLALIRQASDALLRFVGLAEKYPELQGARARALAQLAEATFRTRNSTEGERLVAAAQRALEGVDDEDVRATVWFSAGLADLTALRLSPALTSFANSVECATKAGDPWRAAWGLGRTAFATIMSGAFRSAGPALERARAAQYSLRFWSELSLTEALAAGLALLKDDYVGAAAAARDAIRFYERSGYRFTPPLAFPVLAASYLGLGDDAGARRTIERWRALLPGGQTLFEIAVLADAGQRDEAESLLRGRSLRVPAVGDVDLHRLPSVAAVARIALALEIPDVLVQVLPVVDGLCEHGVLANLGWPTFLPGLAADIATALDEPDADRRVEYARRAERALAST